jgi:2-polyprenyl-3-methyl-5-hydroxy-6-metoxy-1,4-benzoquinol methylase
MEYDRLKWNAKHAAKKGLHQADSFLLKHFELLKPGKALDIACGRGRNALLLAEKGFKVSAVDYSDVGLKILADQASLKQVVIDLIELDLDQPDLLSAYCPFDSIICINFKPLPDLLNLIPNLLSKDGIFLWSSFNEIQAIQTPFPVEKALTEEAFVDYSDLMETLIYERFTDITGARDGYVFKRK